MRSLRACGVLQAAGPESLNKKLNLKKFTRSLEVVVMLNNTVPQPIYLKDYTPPAYSIETVDLYVNLQASYTQLRSRLVMSRAVHVTVDEPLVLHGEQVELVSLQLDGRELASTDYQLTPETLTLTQLPERFVLEVVTRLKPHLNTALEGLYLSNGNYCTQCEAHGFRRMTYFLDRPDVMAVYTTTIEADKQLYPVLLSNGNLMASGDIANAGRHWATWHDPFKKPCYLFALVAGDLAFVEDKFITQSQREVTLRIYVERGSEDKCQHAMLSLKKAMRWDEEKFGREYDLDIFMIVAVSDFNMGAMENKGLNIFNAKYILAKPETATDTDFAGIESVVGHEYFHNWSGNRVTCRDWFQLSLKEGLTVFRDQEFSADMNSRVVQRIKDVRALRSVQFVEDSGPLAHPVRPESYIEMNNFYTVTVYEKGAELIRMLHTILGADRFRKAMDLYFERHDGQAVTCDDFVTAMEEASGIDLSQFRLWYSQAGTPQLTVSIDYDEQQHTCSLHVQQQCLPTPGQPAKQPLLIPLAAALLDNAGKIIREDVLIVHQAVQRFTFDNVAERPIVSLLRNFSAPVKLTVNLSDDELIFLMQHDTDLFNRWDAGQQLAVSMILALIDNYRSGKSLQLNPRFIETLSALLTDAQMDKALIAHLLQLPAEAYLAELMPRVDVDAIAAVRRFVKRQLAEALKAELQAVYEACDVSEPYAFSGAAVARRSLKNICLHYLLLLDDAALMRAALAQLQQANNMTDELAAFIAIAHKECAEKTAVIESFYQKWQHEALVVDKWFSVQATADLPDTLANVRLLLKHPDFSYINPNKVRALIGAFSNNFNCFHDKTGKGYEFLAEQVIHLNRINPQVAARLITALTSWQRFDEQRQQLMKQQLERILKTSDLSKDIFELVTKALMVS